MKLTAAEREALTPWDDGSYSCACPDTCPSLPCDNESDDLTTTVERIVTDRVAAAQHRHLGIVMSCECPHEKPWAKPCQGLISAAKRIFADTAGARGQ